MGKAFGGRPDRSLGLGRIDRVDRIPRAGIYPSKTSGAGQYGSTAYPSIIEAYNRTSDYKRWKMGQELYFGVGRNWASLQIHSLARFFNGTGGDDELDANGSKEVVTLFPSSTSPEGAWYCSTRTRGSLILPAPLAPGQISLDTSSDDPAEHRLLLDCSGFYSTNQLRVYSSFIGDQFEDTASGPTYPTDLVPRPVGSVALTLVGINYGTRSLIFDLSRPHVRIEKGDRVYWQRAAYDPTAPLTFDASSGRYLCSSFKFFCCCPDHLGGAVANLEKIGGSLMVRFPMPNANRTVNSAWESEAASYYRQWRTLPVRRDERRDCKHIHCMRWECGVPWLEPSDYPTGEDRGRFALAMEREGAISPGETMEYFARSQISWSRYILSLADTVGIVLFPGGEPREDTRSDNRPFLWNDGRTPLPEWCRNNDWWVDRGATGLQLFSGANQRFQQRLTKGGVDYAPLTVLEPSDPLAPVIVR
jgi:hypothetical protein